MYDVNDDMENLFRRAAEDYPLKTDGADWQKVEQGLAAAEDVTVPSKNKFNRSWLLLLLLIPGMWICNNYTNTSRSDVVTNAPLKNNLEADNPIVANKENKIVEEKTVTEELPKPTNGVSIKHINKSIKHINNVSLPSTKRRLAKVADIAQVKEVAVAKDKVAVTKRNTTVNYTNGDAKKNTQASIDDKTNDLLEKRDASSQNNIVPDKAIKVNNATENIESRSQPTDTSTAMSYNKDKVLVQPTAGSNEAEKKATIKKTVSNKKFYAGIIGTLDLSTVKFQSTKTIGKGLGILMGYQLTRKLSVETGASTQKKYYFSDAKYFNPKTSYSSPSYKLISVDGNCAMWEVPVNLKYNFSSSVHHNWYSIVGASSYFMQSENYEYTYNSYGQITERYMSYSNSTNYWLAIVNVGVGYERKIGTSGALRVEPYFKVPLKGVGWGRLLITSTGLNIGYTRKLF